MFNNPLIDDGLQFKLFKKIKRECSFDSDILVRMDGNTLAQDDFKLIQQLPKIIQDSGEVGKFNLGNLELTINVMKEYQHTLINVT